MTENMTARALTRLKNSRPVRAVSKRIVQILDTHERSHPTSSRRRAVDVCWALQNLDLFSMVPTESINALAGVSRLVVYKRRAVTLLTEDDGVLIVLSGAAKLCRVSFFGRRLIEAILSPGDLLGRVTQADNAPSTAFELEPLETLHLLRAPRPAFEQLLRAQNDLAISVVQHLEDRQRRLHRRLESLVFKDAQARLIEALLELSQTHGDHCEHGFAVDVRINQQDLADLIGASRQIVNKILGELERSLHVQRMGRTLCILHRERLARLLPCG